MASRYLLFGLYLSIVTQESYTRIVMKQILFYVHVTVEDVKITCLWYFQWVSRSEMKKVLECDERWKTKELEIIWLFTALFKWSRRGCCAWQDFSYRWKNLVDVVAISWSVSWVRSLDDWGWKKVENSFSSSVFKEVKFKLQLKTVFSGPNVGSKLTVVGWGISWVGSLDDWSCNWENKLDKSFAKVMCSNRKLKAFDDL